MKQLWIAGVIGLVLAGCGSTNKTHTSGPASAPPATTATDASAAAPSSTQANTASIPASTNGLLTASAVTECLTKGGLQSKDLGSTASASALSQFVDASDVTDTGFVITGWSANDFQLVSSGGKPVAMIGIFGTPAAASKQVAAESANNAKRKSENLLTLAPVASAKNVAVMALSDQSEITTALTSC